MVKVLVIGGSGLVGSRFAEISKYREELIIPTHQDLNITNAGLTLPRANVIINFAADTRVSEGENQRGDKHSLCWQVNVGGVKNILNSLSPKTFFIQLSTDMVFSGNSGPYTEDEEAETDSTKVTWYGFTKAEAERLVAQRKNSAILRIIYPVRAKFDKKLDYLRKPLKLFDEGRLYPMFTDQQISLSSVDEVCRLLDLLIAQESTGVFHAGSSDSTSPFELFSYFLQKTRGVTAAVKPGSLAEFLKTTANPTRYPVFGGLKVDRTEELTGMKFGTWKEIVDRLVEQGI